MKLYLSSQEIGRDFDKLLKMVGSNRKAAVIANAIDFRDEQTRQGRVAKEARMLAEIGLDPEELDLRDYFGSPKALRTTLERYGLVWIRGGNVFILRRAMILSGFDSTLDLVRDNKVVYGGYSAALAIAGPDLYGSHIVDDPHELPAGYPLAEPPQSALNLVDYYIAAHYLTQQPWGQAVRRYIDFMEADGRKVLRVKDGDVHIVDTSNEMNDLALQHTNLGIYA